MIKTTITTILFHIVPEILTLAYVGNILQVKITTDLYAVQFISIIAERVNLRFITDDAVLVSSS